MNSEYTLPILIIWGVMSLLMVGMGVDIFNSAAKNRRRSTYSKTPEELLKEETRERREGAWIFILSPLAPVFVIGILVVAICYGIHRVFKFFFTTFPEMIRALKG